MTQKNKEEFERIIKEKPILKEKLYNSSLLGLILTVP